MTKRQKYQLTANFMLFAFVIFTIFEQLQKQSGNTCWYLCVSLNHSPYRKKCMSNFGAFPIWHRKNDLYMLNKETRFVRKLSTAIRATSIILGRQTVAGWSLAAVKVAKGATIEPNIR